MKKRDLAFLDSHGHLHSEYADEWVDTLAARMPTCNVRKASLTGVGLVSDHEDEDVLRGYEKYPDLFYPYLCNFNPDDLKSINYVKHHLNSGPWRGVGELFLDTTDTVCANIPMRDGSAKKHPYPVPKDKSDSRVFREVFDLCGEKGIPVFVHCERLKFLCDVLPRHPGTRFLAAHCDYRCNSDDARRMLEAHPNVTCDVGPVLKHMRHKNPADAASIALHDAWRRLMADFPDRITLGTDIYSWAGLTEDAYKRVYDAFHELLGHLSIDHARLIAGGNYKRLMEGNDA
ncbi:MAG: amidohydrolase family protein [Planctomycetota bacterium]